jgi:hypothetical protein
MINECEAVCEMNIGWQNRSTWGKPASVLLCPTQIPRPVLEMNLNQCGDKPENNESVKL